MTTSVQIDDDLHAEIRRLADLGQTTPDQIVREAISQYAGRMDARRSFLREANASWDAYQKDGLHLTADEVSKWLASMGTEKESEMPECHG